MSEPSVAPVLPPLSLDVPNILNNDEGSGSAAQPSPSTQPLSLPTTMAEISLTFLMVNGRRRTMSFAASATIGRVKELVWNSWPAEWANERPPAPNYLRILYLGKMLHDEDVLELIHNPLSPRGPGLSPSFPSGSPGQQAPTIVHLSVRPVPPAGEAEDLKKKKSKRRTGSNTAPDAAGDSESAGCCASCVIC